MALLKANNEFQEAILKHIETQSKELKEKIENGDKTLAGCQRYIFNQMKNKASGGVAVASDQEVYGMAVHFFEEDSVKENQPAVKAVAKFESKPKAVEKKEEPKKAAVVKDGQIEGQLSLF